MYFDIQEKKRHNMYFIFNYKQWKSIKNKEHKLYKYVKELKCIYWELGK
jgi:hypothetical protein